MRAQIAWNVPVVRPRVSVPSIFSIRSDISRAALFVNVTDMIFHGGTPISEIRYATRRVNTAVLPLPGPAITRVGPGGAETASRCASFRPINNSEVGKVWLSLISFVVSAYKWRKVVDRFQSYARCLCRLDLPCIYRNHGQTN